MNYQKIYTDLIGRAIISKRKKNNIEYFEEHHILPKCMGGKDDKNNLVLLTAREHFLAHWILTRIYPTNFKIVYAFNCFCLTSYGYRKISKLYKYAKEKHINALKNDLETRKKNSKSLKKLVWMISPDGKKNTRINIDLVEKFVNLGYSRGRMIKSRKSATRETKEKISKSNKGKIVSTETRKKISKANGGRTYEEMYGKERADKLKQIRREQISINKK